MPTQRSCHRRKLARFGMPAIGLGAFGRPERSIRSSTAEHPWNCAEQDIPVRRQRPSIDILHVHFHPASAVFSATHVRNWIRLAFGGEIAVMELLSSECWKEEKP